MHPASIDRGAPSETLLMSVPPAPVAFSDLALAPEILRAIAEIGYETPSPIQAQCIPELLAGHDVVGQAQTGTGKTAAFALPLLSRLDPALRAPQVLVLTPTRELTLQVAEAFQAYARHLPDFHVLPLYGGQNLGLQLRPLKRGVHVVVGTPGRMMDHLRRGSLDLGRLQAVVLDEADEMLRMGFIEDVEWILEHTPPRRQVALFSATLPTAVRRVADRHLHEPREIRVQSRTTTVETITQRYWKVSGVHKLDALTRILEVQDFAAMLVFVRTKNATVELADKLEARGYDCAPLNGDMNQALREQTVERLKSGSLDIVVATDVAARGLDVERISHVVNYDIPYDTEAYVHRIGRTGRAGRRGEAILFVAPREMRMLRAIEQATRQPIEPMQLPTRQDVENRRIARFKEQLAEALETPELGYFETLLAEFARERDVPELEVAAALAWLLQRERPLQENLPDEPPVRAPEGPRRPRPETRPAGAGGARPTDVEWVTYRVEVGRTHGVEPRNLVGAIANEAGLESRYIGHIRLYDEYSTVDLPAGMPKELQRHLQNVWVCGRRLQLQPEGRPGARGAGRPARPRPAHAKPGGKGKPARRRERES
jgi:ATP-dependent RNA helicase DeaD